MLDDAEYDIILGVEQRLRHPFLDLLSQFSIIRKLNSFDILEASTFITLYLCTEFFKTFASSSAVLRYFLESLNAVRVAIYPGQ